MSIVIIMYLKLSFSLTLYSIIFLKSHYYCSNLKLQKINKWCCRLAVECYHNLFFRSKHEANIPFHKNNGRKIVSNYVMIIELRKKLIFDISIMTPLLDTIVLLYLQSNWCSIKTILAWFFHNFFFPKIIFEKQHKPNF